MLVKLLHTNNGSRAEPGEFFHVGVQTSPAAAGKETMRSQFQNINFYESRRHGVV